MRRPASLSVRQETLIVRHMREAGSITSAAALAVLNVQDLPKRISQLRAEGWCIERELVRDDEGARVAVYRLGAQSVGRELPPIAAAMVQPEGNLEVFLRWKFASC